MVQMVLRRAILSLPTHLLDNTGGGARCSAHHAFRRRPCPACPFPQYQVILTINKQLIVTIDAIVIASPHKQANLEGITRRLAPCPTRWCYSAGRPAAVFRNHRYYCKLCYVLYAHSSTLVAFVVVHVGGPCLHWSALSGSGHPNWLPSSLQNSEYELNGSAGTTPES